MDDDQGSASGMRRPNSDSDTAITGINENELRAMYQRWAFTRRRLMTEEGPNSLYSPILKNRSEFVAAREAQIQNGDVEVEKPAENAVVLRSQDTEELADETRNVLQKLKSQPSESDTGKKRRITLFERVTHKLATNENLQLEMSMGKRIGFYKILQNIGKGNFSQCKLAIHALTKEKCAIKVLDKTKLDMKAQRLLSGEVPNLELLHHPNIIRVYETINTLTKIYIVMEYAALGELRAKIVNLGRLQEMEAKMLFAQVVSAVEHMHEQHICHRDIKAENIFFVAQNVVKIGDFGFSILDEQFEPLTTFCGSPPYAAPELFKDSCYFGQFVDIWACGVLLFFMVSGRLPFRATTIGKLKEKIISVDYIMPANVSLECQELIAGILKLTPTSRLTIHQIKNSDFLQDEDFPAPLDKYLLNPVPTLTNVKADGDEIQAHQQLRKLGISNDLIKDSAQKQSRSSVTGTYRILLHRQHRLSKKESMLDMPIDKTEANKIYNDHNRSKLDAVCEEKSLKSTVVHLRTDTFDTNTTDPSAAYPTTTTLKTVNGLIPGVSTSYKKEKVNEKKRKAKPSKFCVLL